MENISKQHTALTQSEIGRLGYEASKYKHQENKRKRVSLYLEKPKICPICSKIISYEEKRNTFCSRSCSAIFNNTKFPKRLSQSHGCERCNKLTTNKRFCSNKCRRDFENEERISSLDNDNSIKVSHKTIKKYIVEEYGWKCSKCNLETWNDLPIPLELEHIDGNSENNSRENLTLLCPNCHAQTPTYKSKNKGNGRASRRQRYKEGKSY